MDRSDLFKKPVDLNEWAYSTIKHRILNNEIKAGEQLKVEDLANELNISRTPIREALIALKRDGLVTSEARVGFFVRGITKEEFDNLFEIPMPLEGFAAEKIVTTITDKDIAILVKTHQKSKQAAEKGNLQEFNKLEIQIHEMISNIKNDKIKDVIDSIHDLIYRERLLALQFPENIKRSINEHELLIEAIKTRDGQLAKKRMEQHIQGVKERLSVIIKDN